MAGPLLTLEVHDSLAAARRAGTERLECSLDLGRSVTTVEPGEHGWAWRDQRYPYLDACKPRTVYHWSGAAFQPVARYDGALVKLVPTEWGPPTFEIDGIKMLPTAQVSPWEDARRKVELVRPRNKVVLDTCGGLGYFAAWCIEGGARRVLSYEKNPQVIWLRGLNPWSPTSHEALSLVEGDVTEAIATLPDASVEAVLHDPPRFGIAGELYSRVFYVELARVLSRGGILFHYTGTPNTLTSGRDVPREVARRLREAGFSAGLHGDGVLGTRRQAIPARPSGR
jgi:predicted methyltransferase